MHNSSYAAHKRGSRVNACANCSAAADILPVHLQSYKRNIVNTVIIKTCICSSTDSVTMNDEPVNHSKEVVSCSATWNLNRGANKDVMLLFCHLLLHPCRINCSRQLHININIPCPIKENDKGEKKSSLPNSCRAKH